MDSNFQSCASCFCAKCHKLPFVDSNKNFEPLELIHTDLWGPSPIISHNGYAYYVSFIDHATRFVWFYLVKSKSDTTSALVQFKTLVENLHSQKIKIVQSDGGIEYKPLTKLFLQHGITHRMSCPYTLEQNGIAERKHHHIVEVGLSLLDHSNVPSCFWDDAFVSAAHIINHTPSKLLNYKTPVEILTHSPPNF